MKVKLLLVAAALLTMASLGFSQPFLAGFTSLYPLTDACPPEAGEFVPDGVIVSIYWDANSNGADDADVLAPLCPENEPGCPNGHNFNQFPVNGGELGAPGMFVTMQYFGITIPPNPSRYYLVLRHSGVKWTSDVYTIVPGPQDFYLEAANWHCEVTAEPCVPTPDTYFTPGPVGPQNQSACVTLCASNPVHRICVGPVPLMDRIPVMHVESGCAGSDCNGATGYELGGTWVWTEENGAYYYCNQLVLGLQGTEGCVTVYFDEILPVEGVVVTVKPLSESVSVAWTTASETGVDRFEVYRNNRKVAEREATNTPQRAEYSFVDEGLNNGTTYEYKLVMVNVNGSSEVLATESVTPSYDNAVVTEYALQQNFPNPFNPTTTIAFDLVEDNTVTLTVFNATGQEVATVMSNRAYSAGRQRVTFDATNLTSGLYFYTVKIGNEFTATKKMLLVK